MKVKVIMSALCVCLGVAYADGVDIDDERLRNALKATFLNIHSIKGDLSSLLADINFASNRLVAAAKDVYYDSASSVRQKGRAMSVVSTYGVPEDVEFTISCATNHEFWEQSCIGVLKLCGVTSNSIARIDGLMNSEAVTNGVERLESKQDSVIFALLMHASKTGVSLENRNAAWDYSMTFASNHMNLAESMDWALKKFNPSFERSKTRKGLLLYWQANNPDDCCRGYISRALDALNQIPESELSD